MGKPTSIVVVTERYRQLAEEFYKRLLQVGYQELTARIMRSCVNEFLQHAERQIGPDIGAIRAAHLSAYYRYLQSRPSRRDGRPLHAGSVQAHFNALEHFFTLLEALGEIDVHPMNALRLPHPKPDKESPRTALTQEAIGSLYRASETLQERAILALGYGCGLRVSELVQCNIEDIRLREGILIVPKGKGNKSRIVPLSRAVRRDLSAYFFKERSQQQAQDPKAFLLHSRGGRMQEWTYNKRLKKLIERSGDKTLWAGEISIHHLRHSIATHLIEAGVPLESVREFLGHAELETTEQYTHIGSDQLKALAGCS